MGGSFHSYVKLPEGSSWDLLGELLLELWWLNGDLMGVNKSGFKRNLWGYNRISMG
jgi:hypothetical protein